MALSLSDIEAKADELAAALDGAGAALAKDLTTKLEGLAYAATIKRVADDRATWNVSVGIREREVAAMEQAAEANVKIAAQQAMSQLVDGLSSPRSAGLCLNRSPELGFDRAVCILLAGHTGAHRSDGGMSWTDVDLPEPTKPAIDRLHELVSYGKQQDQAYAGEDRGAYDDMTTKLQEIIAEGGL